MTMKGFFFRELIRVEEYDSNNIKYFGLNKTLLKSLPSVPSLVWIWHNLEVTSWPGPRGVDRATSHTERACCSQGCILAPCLTLLPILLPELPSLTKALAHHSVALDRGLEGKRLRDALIPSVLSLACRLMCFLLNLPMEVYRENCPCPRPQPDQDCLRLTSHPLTRAHSPASDEILFEVYYLLVHRLGALRRLV